MSKVLGYYIDNLSQIKTVVQEKSNKTVSFINSSVECKKCPVAVSTKKNVQVVSELAATTAQGLTESETFTLYPDIDMLWSSFKVEE